MDTTFSKNQAYPRYEVIVNGKRYRVDPDQASGELLICVLRYDDAKVEPVAREINLISYEVR